MFFEKTMCELLAGRAKLSRARVERETREFYGKCPECNTQMVAPPRRWGMSCTKYCPLCKHNS